MSKMPADTLRFRKSALVSWKYQNLDHGLNMKFKFLKPNTEITLIWILALSNAFNFMQLDANKTTGLMEFLHNNIILCLKFLLNQLLHHLPNIIV